MSTTPTRSSDKPSEYTYLCSYPGAKLGRADRIHSLSRTRKQCTHTHTCAHTGITPAGNQLHACVRGVVLSACMFYLDVLPINITYSRINDSGCAARRTHSLIGRRRRRGDSIRDFCLDIFAINRSRMRCAVNS